MASSQPVRSDPEATPKRRVRSSSGITRSLQTMVDTAMVSTMTMPVAADRPPTKASSASAGWPCINGNESTKLSAPPSAPAPPSSKPPSAIGSTNRLISSR